MTIADIRAYIATTSQVPPAIKDVLIGMLNKIDQPELLPFQLPIPEGHRIVTRNGKFPTEFGKYETCTESNCLYGVIDGVVESWFESGGYSVISDPLDLFLLPPAPEMVTMWVNYYRYGAEIFNTEYGAEANKLTGRIGPAIKITFQKPIS